MAIYVDEIRTYPKGKFSHMWTDGDDAQLDFFAAQIGLKKQWSHTSTGGGGRFYHYDVTPNKRVLALRHGAVFMPLKEWITKHMSRVTESE